MAATDKQRGGGGGTGLSWDAFEEQAKLAFVSDAARTRLTLKTRVGTNKKVAVVARVVSQSPREAAQEQATGGGGGVRSVKYQTNETGHLFRLTRLLRFAMQEVLGPMRTTEAKPAAAAAASTPAPAPAPAAGGDAKPKKKKSKGKKKH